MTPDEQKITALAGIVGTLLGMLQGKELMADTEVQELFRAVREGLPDSAVEHGHQVLKSVREVAATVAEASVWND